MVVVGYGGEVVFFDFSFDFVVKDVVFMKCFFCFYDFKWFIFNGIFKFLRYFCIC